MASPLVKTLIICFTALVYIIHLVFNSLAAKGETNLFPMSASNVSRTFQLELTPTGATFTIWGFIFAIQLSWIIYSITRIFKKNNTIDMLSTKFYLCFIANILFITVWLFSWSRRKTIECLIFIIIGQLCLNAAFALSCIDLRNYLLVNKGNIKSFDIWCQRILVQNGLLFYATWTTVATLINVAIVLSYNVKFSTVTSSLISLSILGVLAAFWFYLENFVFRKYTEYTVSAYISLIYALTGVFSNISGKNAAVAGTVLTLLLLSIIFFIIRVLLIVYKKKKVCNINNTN
ncbi:uncharacterized protein LOC105846010 isoform X1 [Hydra vulgaris]|uniref:uncharacterized protein LOC105846010 isoform X1 n=1 Tax=Hydra vulgaris TaxID=6087 RepID=UPI001F5FEC9F|nr:uncharacterized protein LOC105846010 [Hydra vulgaris]